MGDEDRVLSEADVEAIAAALERRVMDNLDQYIGRGVRRMVMRMLLIGMLILALMGYLDKFPKLPFGGH